MTGKDAIMAPEEAPGKVEGEVTDPQQGKQDPTPSSGAQEDPKPVETPKVGKDTVLPDDHPLIVKHSELKAKLSKATGELTEARAASAKATKLQEELDARPTQEAMDTLQTRYDRLEAFLQAAGGPIGKALDSRTFTRDLFESDKDIADLVKQWHKDNPTQTSSALGAGGADPGKSKADINAALRAALQTGK